LFCHSHRRYSFHINYNGGLILYADLSVNSGNPVPLGCILSMPLLSLVILFCGKHVNWKCVPEMRQEFQ
jgi:hypothetical protein